MTRPLPWAEVAEERASTNARGEAQVRREVIRPPLSMNVSRGCRWGGTATAAPRNVTRRGVPYHMYTCSDAHARRARHHRSVLTRPQHRARQWRGNRGAACSLARGRHRTRTARRAIAPNDQTPCVTGYRLRAYSYPVIARVPRSAVMFRFENVFPSLRGRFLRGCSFMHACMFVT